MDWQGALATALAAVGTAVSLYTAYAGWRDRHPRVAVELACGTVEETFEDAGRREGHHQIPELALAIRVINRGAVDIVIARVGLLGPDGRPLPLDSPHGTLVPGEPLRSRDAATFWVGPEEAARALAGCGYAGRVAVRAECVDGAGTAYRSAPVPFEVAGHLAHAPGRRHTGLPRPLPSGEHYTHIGHLTHSTCGAGPTTFGTVGCRCR